MRAVELVFACDEALRLVEALRAPEPAAVGVPLGAGVGAGATEAPRGLLLHRYDIDADGVIATARIVPPTSQNQLTIETDLRHVVQAGLDLVGRRADLALRASGAQSRPVHLVRRRTSSTSRWSGSEGRCEHRGGGPPGRRCPQGRGGRPGQRVPPRRRRWSCRGLHGDAAMHWSDCGRAAGRSTRPSRPVGRCCPGRGRRCRLVGFPARNGPGGGARSHRPEAGPPARGVGNEQHPRVSGWPASTAWLGPLSAPRREWWWSALKDPISGKAWA